MSWYRIGEWQTGEPPKSTEKHYCVTMAFDCCGNPTETSQRLISDEFYRYTGTWEFYSEGGWYELSHENFKVIAYAEVEKLEPYMA